MATLPVVVIVGRPNVGKSTLFNAITGQRRSIVGDEPGITRDRIHGQAVHMGKPFELIDTGGIIPNDAEMIPTEILKQARFALEAAAQIIFLIDGRTEITGTDRELAAILRKLGKPVTLVVNKIDATVREHLTHEFHVLGFRDVFPVSSEHRLGLHELLDHITSEFPVADTSESEETKPVAIKVAIIGRPNVGKSTLLNALVGQERSIVSPVAGTTRDSVDETLEVEGTSFTFVDTAGIRRKGKTTEMAEKLSVVMARRSIRMANVVLLVVDATEGVVGADATIAGYAHEDGRCLIVVVNKWDLSNGNRKAFAEQIQDNLKFLEYAPVVFVSAKGAKGTDVLFGMIREAFESASKRIGTGELNRFASHLKLDQDFHVRYITQPSIRPPTFLVFTDKGTDLHFSIERFLMNRLRKEYGFRATPIVIKARRR
jgi:GTP-binding protein